MIALTSVKDHPHRGNSTSKSFLYVLLPLIVAILLRTYPYLASGLPFSVDSWPSIKYTELLLEKTPVHLGDVNVFRRSYDQLGEKLFGATISVLTGSKPIHAVALLVPVVGATSILVFYALAYSLYRKRFSLLASLLLAIALSDVILTAGVKGETYAHLLYLLLILLFLNERIGWWRKVLLFALTSASLTLTHYYTSILTVAILASMGLGAIIIRGKEGKSLNIRVLLLPAVLATSILAYLLIYANWAFNFIFSIDLLSALSYQIVLFSFALWLALKPQTQNRIRTVLACSLAFVAVLAFLWLGTRRPLAPIAPILPTSYLLYASPFAVLAPLCVLGYGKMREMSGEQHVTPLFWLATVLGLEGYAIFGNIDPSLGLMLAYRGINFLLPTLALLSAIGIQRLYKYEKLRSKEVIKVGVAIPVLLILSINVYGIYATIHLQERYMGYFWLYRLPEYRAALWLKDMASNYTVAGDVKALYLLNQYFDVNVDAFQGLRYLTGAESQKPQLLFIYDQMLKNGYVVYGGQIVNLPANWAEKLYELSLVYSNSLTKAYIK